MKGIKLLLLLLTPLLLSGIVYASPPVPMSGTLTSTGEVVNWVRTANGNTIMSQTGTSDLTGSFEGTAADSGTYSGQTHFDP